MEAPEKIWINPSTDLPKLNGIIDKDSVQYIRKDAFIEKACDVLAKIHKNYSTNSLGTEYLINDFKKAMEE